MSRQMVGALTAHMKRLCQAFAGPELGSVLYCGCLMAYFRCAGGGGGAWPVWAHALIAAGPCERRSRVIGARSARRIAAIRSAEGARIGTGRPWRTGRARCAGPGKGGRERCQDRRD
jgi:hypothetical protein